ncbi:hypothetical protein SAMN05421541_107482 [Actinoplanes philippinensis]|uniref:Energy-coupling factor transport system substrate-specific component n=1 Tax=Actinoplanes philippinensis TaxID=35752 RepID=A0A1I2H754_9ACTN|nr:hypothetical protein SAMN05421541_107482 [Actinoplanes philippinensis]
MRTIEAPRECDDCRPDTPDDANRKKAEAIAERPAAPHRTALCRPLAETLRPAGGLPNVAAVSNPRYTLRSAAFVTVYLAAFLIAPIIPASPLAPLVAGGVWLTAQAGYGLRRLDVILLATATAVGATVQGAGLLMSITVAVWAVLPSVLFAVLLERLLPGYWRGHGDRFRRPAVAVATLAGIALLTAGAAAMIGAVIDTGSWLAVPFARDAIMLFLAPLAVNTVHRLRSPRRAGLTVVR